LCADQPNVVEGDGPVAVPALVVQDVDHRHRARNQPSYGPSQQLPLGGLSKRCRGRRRALGRRRVVELDPAEIAGDETESVKAAGGGQRLIAVEKIGSVEPHFVGPFLFSGKPAGKPAGGFDDGGVE
jgi:hypothetical protein